jgi:hypothetical protein
MVNLSHNLLPPIRNEHTSFIDTQPSFNFHLTAASQSDHYQSSPVPESLGWDAKNGEMPLYQEKAREYISTIDNFKYVISLESNNMGYWAFTAKYLEEDMEKRLALIDKTDEKNLEQSLDYIYENAKIKFSSSAAILNHQVRLFGDMYNNLSYAQEKLKNIANMPLYKVIPVEDMNDSSVILEYIRRMKEVGYIGGNLGDIVAKIESIQSTYEIYKKKISHPDFPTQFVSRVIKGSDDLNQYIGFFGESSEQST